MNSNTQFINACKSGDLNLVQKMLNDKPELKNILNLETGFYYACTKGHLDVAEWMYSISEYHMYIDVDTFIWSCGYGHFEIAQFLFKVDPNLNTLPKSTQAFTIACGNGKIDVAEWLLTLPNNYKDSDYADAFGNACIVNNLVTAQWLFSIKKEICISAIENQTYIFTHTCRNNSAKVALWLQSLMPMKFIVKTIEYEYKDGSMIQKITNSSIRPTNESNALALITMLEKTGYGNQLRADLLSSACKSI